MDLLVEHRYETYLEVDRVRLHGGFVGKVYYPPRSWNRAQFIAERAAAHRVSYEYYGHPRVPVIKRSWPAPRRTVSSATLYAAICVKLLSMLEGERSGAHIRDIDISAVNVLGPSPGSSLAKLGELLNAHALDEAGCDGAGGHAAFVSVLLRRLWDRRADELFPAYLNKLRYSQGAGSASPGIPLPLVALVKTLAKIMWREYGTIFSIRELSRLLDNVSSREHRDLVRMLNCMLKDEVLHFHYLRVVLAELTSLCQLTDGFVPENPVVTLVQEAASEVARENEAACRAYRAVLKTLGVPAFP